MPTKYIIASGDCVSSLAHAHGLSVDSIWNDPLNANLRERRESAFVLLSGDEITIPDRQPKEVICATGRQHVFRRRDVPETLRIALLDSESVPREGITFELVVDGKITKGTAGTDGLVAAWIPPDAMSATLRVGDEEVYDLKIGALAPIDDAEGVHERMVNLGYGDLDMFGPSVADLVDFRRGMIEEAELAEDVSTLADDDLTNLLATELRTQHGI